MVLSTAVPQTFLGIGTEEYKTGLTVQACATAGLGNLRAPGDPAGYSEEDPDYLHYGTINIIVCVNRYLPPKTRFESIAAIAVARAAVVGLCGIYSEISDRLCLGTGTDCFALCFSRDKSKPLQYAGPQVKFGEVLANAVIGAVEEAMSHRERHVKSLGSR